MRLWIFLAFLTACPSSKEETGDTSAADTADTADTAAPEALVPNTGTWHINGVVVNSDTCELDDGKVGKKPEGTLTLTENEKGTYSLNPSPKLADFACALTDYTLSCDELVFETDYDFNDVEAVVTLTYTFGLVFTDASSASASWGITYACEGADCGDAGSAFDAMPNPCDYAAEGEATYVPDADVGPPPAFSD